MRRWFSICNIHSWNTRLGTPNDTRSWEHKSDPGGWGYTLGSCVGSDTLLFPVRVFCCALWVSPVRTGPCHTWVINATWVWLRPWRGPCCHLTHLEKRLQAIGSAGQREGAAWHSAWGFGIYSSTDLFPFFTPGYLEVCLHRRKGRGFSDEFLAGT